MTGGPIIPLTLEHAALIALTPDDIIARSKAKYLYAWWESNDPYKIFPAQLREPVLLIPFERMKEAAELVLGRSVLPMEFLNRQRLLSEFAELMAA